MNAKIPLADDEKDILDLLENVLRKTVSSPYRGRKPEWAR